MFCVKLWINTMRKCWLWVAMGMEQLKGASLFFCTFILQLNLQIMCLQKYQLYFYLPKDKVTLKKVQMTEISVEKLTL